MPSSQVATFKHGCSGTAPANCLLCGRESGLDTDYAAITATDVTVGGHKRLHEDHVDSEEERWAVCSTQRNHCEGMESSPDAFTADLFDNVLAQNKSQHVYSPVSKAKNEIRLFSIDPGDPSSPILGRFIKAALRSKGQLPYEALSYTWADESGDRKYSEHVWMDAGYLLVTKNGAAALRRVRMRTKARLIWMDQLCINQADALERSQQVRLMSKIYGNASQVLVYLGSSPIDNFMLPNLHHDLEKPQTLECEQCRSLLCLPWFTRIWVLQEVARARKAVMLLGNTCETFESFRKGLIFAQFKAENGGVCDPLPGALSIMPRKPVPAADIFQLLISTNACHATDPRDKVFALFGLIDSAQKHGLIADYKMDTEEVYTRITLYIIQSSRKLDVLAYCSGERNILSLPSWVPDWSVKRREPLITYIKRFLDVPKLDKLLGDEQASVVYIAGSRNLSVWGRCLGSVNSCWATNAHGSRQYLLLGIDRAFKGGARGFTTNIGPGLGAREVHQGDQIWQLDGAEQFFALRKFGRAFKVVGEFFLPGLFEGRRVPDFSSVQLLCETFYNIEAEHVQLC